MLTTQNEHPDVAQVSRIAAVPRILNVLMETTGMRFAAVARVTDMTWTACAVRDELGFGLLPGGELELESTICNEIRQNHTPVVFGHASTHPHFSQHHTPKLYGLESYLSVPIFRMDGTFFGTLCAIDNRPADLDDPRLLRQVELMAELIGLQLEVEDDLRTSQQQLKDAESRRILREQMTAVAEREIRDLFQPIVTGLYLLRTSPSINAGDLGIVADMHACCQQMSERLRGTLDEVHGRIQGSQGALQVEASALES